MAGVSSTADNSKNHGNDNSKDKSATDLTVKFHLIQRQLVLIFHAQRCTQAACLLPNCSTMKHVLQHQAICTAVSSNPKCPFQFCFSTRQILTHWWNRGRKCEVCDPMQQLLTASPTSPEKRGAAKKENGVGSSKEFRPQRISFPMARFNIKLWDVVLEWSRPAAPASGGPKTYTKISLPCQVFTHSAAAASEVGFTPSRLHVKLIPSSILHKLGLMQHVRPLLFQFSQAEEQGVGELVEALKSGQYSGYVRMECGPAHGSFKLLILQCNAPSGEFMGYKPTNQQEFIDRLKAIVEQERNRGLGNGQTPTTTPAAAS